jgi:hypothetical protein
MIRAFAVMAWGQPRATTDVNVLLALDDAKVTSLVAALRHEGLSVDPDDLVQAFKEGGHASILDEQSSYHIDVKPARNAQEREQLAHGIVVPFEEGSLRVADAEETIADKLMFESPLDWQDAQSVMARQGERLDTARLSALAVKLGVADKLETLRRRMTSK